jgi:ubiquinone/menaquinone biosynthesis C-methylase UbiE
MDQQELTAQQFGTSATAYLHSAVHASGADLDRLTDLTERLAPARVLDLGCGAGHVSFALARGGAASVTAYDPSADMLDVVAREAAGRGITCIGTQAGVAETLPFDAASFDLVVTRFSAHHWANVPKALAECARVTRAQGRLVVIDVCAPETPLLDTALQVLEFLRDASHVRNYRLSEWRAMLQAAGFGAPAVSDWKLPMEFSSWIARIKTPPARVCALEAVFAALPREANEYFHIDAAHGFAIDVAWLESLKVG